MKRLSAKDVTRQEQIAERLEKSREAYNEKVQEVNDFVIVANDELASLADAYSKVLEEAHDFAAEVAAEASGYAEERSEKWQESAVGQAHAAWVETWNAFAGGDLVAASLDEIDEPDDATVAAFLDLPEEP